MADNADQAGDTTDKWTELCVNAARSGGTVNDHNDLTIDHKECTECGDKIPIARRKAIPGVSVCVLCAEREEIESNKRGYI